MASNVVGVSIPAEILTPPSAAATPSGSTPGPTTRPRRATLISLLNNYPAPPPTKSTGPVSFASAAAKAAPAPTLAPPPSRVVPRGLINTGNLCFANSVLQVLVVYCGALRGLLTALEPLLERDVALGEGSFPGLGENDFLGAGSGVKERESSTPVLDATIRLLREFLPSNKGKERAAESSAVNGDASGWSRVGKSGLEEEEEREAFMPTFVYDALMKKRRFGHLKLGQQEDAEEFLGFYLDELEEELESLLKDSDQQGNGIAGEVDGWTEVAKGKKNAVVRGSGPLHNSPISRIFGGTFRSTLHQPKKPDSVTVERWQRLMLDVEHESIDTIEDAIQRLVQPQPISDPASPTAQGPMMLQLQIASLPPVLVVHLKRFFYSADEVKKVSKEVRFGPILDFPANSNVLAKRTSAAKYRLFAVLYHHGRSAAGGHYTLDVLCPTRFALPSATQNAGKPGPPKAAPSVANKTGPAPQRFREGWIRIDDELVSDIRPEDVFGPGARSGGRWEEDGGRCAYLLFYERIG
ncbi:hypothetical protein BD626DRAFT_405830 [Schizophyllum amplum]|uniref:Ubiquitin carboxyl-terminal hydrolase n=1 Tax=Schizophyllum amplum TaxID=97359 RepID=A0A550C951_9AGAR|nr:hypothetical protein BD626DRAFT_405830 [Auriculariopsis ampla]